MILIIMMCSNQNAIGENWFFLSSKLSIPCPPNSTILHPGKKIKRRDETKVLCLFITKGSWEVGKYRAIRFTKPFPLLSLSMKYVFFCCWTMIYWYGLRCEAVTKHATSSSIMLPTSWIRSMQRLDGNGSIISSSSSDQVNSMSSFPSSKVWKQSAVACVFPIWLLSLMKNHQKGGVVTWKKW